MTPPRRQSFVLLACASLMHVALLWGLWDTQKARHLDASNQVIQLSLSSAAGRLGSQKETPSWLKSPAAKSIPRPTKHKPNQAAAAKKSSSPQFESVALPQKQKTQENEGANPQPQTAVTSKENQSENPNGNSTDQLNPGTDLTSGPIDLGDAATSGSLGAYEAAVLEQIRNHEYYPKSARVRRLYGEVIIQFTILSDGTLGTKFIKNSSGYDVLDEAAEDIIDASAPFPAPESYGLGMRTYVLPLLFRLNT